MGRGQRLPPRRRGSLHSEQGCRARRAHRYSTSFIFHRYEDAWLLDVTDQLSAPLARDGDPEPIHLEETDTSFAIGWKGHYHIEGTAFIYADRDSGRVRAILGYPTETIARAS